MPGLSGILSPYKSVTGEKRACTVKESNPLSPNGEVDLEKLGWLPRAIGRGASFYFSLNNSL